MLGILFFYFHKLCATPLTLSLKCVGQFFHAVSGQLLSFRVCFKLKAGNSCQCLVEAVTHLCCVWQAAEGPGIRCSTRRPTARPGSAPEEAAEGAELGFLPAQDAGAEIRSVLPDRDPVHHIPRCLHVCHPSSAQVRRSVQLRCISLHFVNAFLWSKKETVSNKSAQRVATIIRNCVSVLGKRRCC